MSVAAAGEASPPATEGRREQTKAQNRAAILDAARAVFAEMGYGAASVRDVIRRTDLAAGTFYNYFPDKESVLRALVEASAGELRARLRTARVQATTLEEFVGDAYRVYFAYLAEDRPTFELMRRNAGTIRQLLEEPALGGGVDDLREDLEAAAARGELPAIDAEYMAAAMSGVGIEVGMRMIDREPVDIEGAARFATRLFLGGIRELASGS